MNNLFKKIFRVIKYLIIQRNVYGITSFIRVLPDFFVVGVVRSGTTSLYHYLDQHPCIMKSAYDELGFTGERSSERGPIYCGDKSGNYPGNNSRSGSGSTGYWDLGESAARTFRFSTGNEQGAGGNECYTWSPHRIYVA